VVIQVANQSFEPPSINLSISRLGGSLLWLSSVQIMQRQQTLYGLQGVLASIGCLLSESFMATHTLQCEKKQPN
jgi:hypothetical protein